MNDLPDIDEENAKLKNEIQELPDIDEKNAKLSTSNDELPDINIQNAQLSKTSEELPDINAENAKLSETNAGLSTTNAELPDINVENANLTPTDQPQTTVDAEKNTPDTHWQEVEERKNQPNLGDEIYNALSAVGKKIGNGLATIEKGKMRLEGMLFPADSLQSEMAASGGAVAGKMIDTTANVATGAGEAVGNLFGIDGLRNFSEKTRKFINQKIDTDVEPLVTGDPEWDKRLEQLRGQGSDILSALFAYSVPHAATVDIAASSINKFFSDLRDGLNKGMSFNKASSMALVDAGLEGAKGMTLKRILKGTSGPGQLMDKLVEEMLTMLKFAGIDYGQNIIQQGFSGAKNPNLDQAKEAGQEGLKNAAAYQTLAAGARKIAGAAFGDGTNGQGAVQDFEAEREKARQEAKAMVNRAKLTPEQESTLNMRIPEFTGEDTDMQGKVREKIVRKMTDEAVNGTPKDANGNEQTPLRERLNDPAEMEAEIMKATEEVLFENNTAEIAKNVNTSTLGMKAGETAAKLASKMPRTADATECRIAGLIARENPDMDADRVWTVAEHLAAKGFDEKIILTKDRVEAIEKEMAENAAETVPVEQPDGSLKTVSEMEAETAREERKTGIVQPTVETAPATAPVGPLEMAKKPVDRSIEWTPVEGKDNVWHTPEFPDVEIGLEDAPAETGTNADGTPRKRMMIDNLPNPDTLDDAGKMKLGKFLIEQKDLAEKMGIDDVVVSEDPEMARKYGELVDTYKDTVREEKFKVRADSMIDVLKKSALQSEVVDTEADFNAKLAEFGDRGEKLIADGMTYGFTDGEKVYINPKFFSTRRGLDTPIHEFGHLAIIATKQINRPLYDRALELIKQTDYWNELNDRERAPDYVDLVDEKKGQEALTRMIADRGQRLEATTPKGVIDELKKILVEIWKSFGNALGIRDLTPERIEKMSIEDIADAIRAEMTSGREFGTRELSLQEGDLKAKILRFAKYSKPTSKSAKEALEAAKKAWKGLSEEQKTALGQYGDTSILKTQDARTIANGVRMLREWDARRARISETVKAQMKKAPNEGQMKILTGSPKYYISEVTGDVTSPFAYAVDKGLPIPRKGDFGWDAWENLTDGMKYAEKRRLEKIIGGEHPKRGGMDTVLSDYAQWLGITWDEGARDFEHGRGIEDFLDDILKERDKFEQWRAGDRMTRAQKEAEAAKAKQNGMTESEFAEEDAWVKASEKNRIERERMGETEDLNDMPDFSRGNSAMNGAARDVGPSSLGDGKQKYYEVPFETAVDKIVKAKKAIGNDEVFVSSTPKPLHEIGLAKLPIVMNQNHVLTCYFDVGEGVKGKHLHGLNLQLKTLPTALERPLMIIASETRPNDSVVEIVKMRNKKGEQIFVPIEINGIGRVGNNRIDAHVVTSTYGRKNAWTKLIAKALRDETEGKVAIFYLDKSEARTIENRLAKEAFNFGRAEVQSLRRSKSNVWHSITDPDSPVNGGRIANQTDSQQFKRWFGDSKIVDADWKPLVVYHGSTWDPLTEKNGMAVFKTGQNETGAGAHFGTEQAAKERAEGNRNWNIGKYYLSIKNPLEVADTGYWTPGDIVAEVRKTISDFPWFDDWNAIKTELQKRGYDGLKYKNVVEDEGSTSYVAFEPTQIKSATDNIGTFDPANPDVRFSRGGRAQFVAERTRVATDAEHGELSPGGLASAKELAAIRNTPVSALGTRRFLSLPISDLEELRKMVSGDIRPAYVKKSLPDDLAGTSTKKGKVAILSDTIGVVDRTDMEKEKTTLKAHGFFRNEDPNWCLGQSAAAVKAERIRSNEQLSRQLEALGDRRMKGLEAGGQTAERGVFADEVAKIVMAQERHVGGRLGRLQTIGKTVQKAVDAMPGMNAADAEWSARRFLDWSYGQPNYSQNMSGKDLTAEMFGKWLVMPQEVEARAPEWALAIEGTIAADRQLSDSFRTLADRRLNGDEYLFKRLRKQLDRQTEAALMKLNREANEPISAGSNWKGLKESFLYGLHDTFAPVYVRMDTATKTKIKAMKAALRAAPPAARPALKQQIDLYLGDLGDRLNRLELARTAYERGGLNEASVYYREMVRLENEATERWGLTTEDISFYLDQMRVIETNGRSAANGEDVYQAHDALLEMQSRLGPEKWRRMQQYGNTFHAIHEQELLNDPRAEKMFGKAYIDYLKTQTHYVTTKRVHSQEELDAIDAARANARRAGVSGGDDVIGQMYAYGGAKGAGRSIGEADWTAKQFGSMAAKRDARGATFEKVDRLQRALRRNQLVLDLREALTFANVKGVKDMPRIDGMQYPEGSRYGHLNYLENGQKRTLVVPRQIADAFNGNGNSANWYSKTARTIHNVWRSLIIDYNPAYWPMNIRRNQDSIEKNMPGMRETYVKTALRALHPGLGTMSDLVFQTVVRNIPASAKLFSDKTVFAYIPQMERICKIVERPGDWQQEYWKAEDSGDTAKLAQMDSDWNMCREMMKANMFVSLGSTYRGEIAQTFAADALAKKGLKTIDELKRERAAKSGTRKFVEAVNFLKKNQAQQEHEDILAKGIAYLADRKHYGLVRTSEESGDLVNRRVSIAQGERRGAAAKTMKMIVPFFNMIEKGVVRHWDAYRTDPGHTLGADAKFFLGRASGLLMATGLAQMWMLKNSDGDEEKAKQKFGKFYDYAKDYHGAYRNCSEYVRKNYNFTPIWTQGYTSVIIGGAMTDEEKLISPMVDFTVNTMAASEGLTQQPSFGSTILDSTVRAVVPDLQMTGPIIEGLRLAVVAATGENQTDLFREAPMFDQKTLDMRYDSLEDFGEFSAAVGARLWNYGGGRSIISMDVNGVDNGRGEAPKTLENVLRKIPWVSPAINRMVKIQVGSPEKDAKNIRANGRQINQVIDKCAARLLDKSEGQYGYHETNSEAYEQKIAEFAKTYGLDEYDQAVLRKKYLNGWIQRRCRESFDQRLLLKTMQEGRRRGMSESEIWIQLGER